MSAAPRSGPPRDVDGYERYYAEKLWDWVPEIYREEDGLLSEPGTLRAFIETFAAEAAEQRRSIDRLWDDTIVDHADDWAVPYIGELVGARMLSALNARGRRLDVAKTVAYRRRAGTPYVLEELIQDVTGWHGAILEGFTRLARTRHNYDSDADFPPGRYATPPGGTANLRRPADGERVDGPFEPYAHLADLRATRVRAGGALESPRGLWNIPKLNVHLFRQRAWPLENVTPYRIDDRRFTADPSGRDRALFARAARFFAKTPSVARMEETGVGWSPAREWQMPAPIGCRLFNEAAFRPRGRDLQPLGPDFDPLDGVVFETTADLRARYVGLAPGGAPDWSLFADLLDASVTEDSPRRRLYGPEGSVDLGLGSDPAGWALTMAEVSAADLSRWADPGGAPALPAFPPEASALFDPARGRIATAPPVTGDTRLAVRLQHVGGFHEVGAAPYARGDLAPAGQALPFVTAPGPADAGLIDLAAWGTALAGAGDTTTVYETEGNPTVRLSGVRLTAPNLTLQASDQTRPYLRLEPTGGAREFVIEAAALPDSEPPDLTLDGLWLGLRPEAEASLDQTLAAPEDEPAPEVFTLALEGDFKTVQLRSVTLDPGGETARADPLVARPIPAVRLEIRGAVDRLLVNRSILGPIAEVAQGDVCSIGAIEIRDSVVVAGDASAPAIDTALAPVRIERTTVLGDVRVNRLFASETIVTGYVEVSDNQNGCFRFSAARAGVGDPLDPAFERPPQQFRSKRIEGDFAPLSFVSTRFGDAGFCQLSPWADPHLVGGAENGAEIGVFHRALAPVKLRDLRAKIDEFKPIHLVAQYVLET